MLDTDLYEELLASGKSYKDVKMQFKNIFFNDDVKVDPQYFYAVIINKPDPKTEINDLIEDNLSEGFFGFISIINVAYNELKNVRITFLHNDENIAKKYNIKEGAPTFILFKNGKEIKRFDGLYTKISDLISAYNENM